MADLWNDEERKWLAAVGMRVRLARIGLRISQEELGRRATVSRVTVGSVERGDHPAAVLIYRRIAATLGMPLAELLLTAPSRPTDSGGRDG